MLEIGQKVDTSISFEVVDKGEEKTSTLAELLEKPLVVSIYMKNNTGSCDKQTKFLAESTDDIRSRGYEILAVSKDNCNSHKKYAVKQGIDYLLASDPDNKISEAFDSIVEKNMYGKKYMGPSRSAFVLDTDGTVLGIIEKVKSKEHGIEVLALLDSLK